MVSSPPRLEFADFASVRADFCGEAEPPVFNDWSG